MRDQKALLRLLRLTNLSISRWKSRKKSVILSLSDCLLRQIFDNLPLVEQVCLSLSCKRFFNLFGAIVKHEKFMFPRLLDIKNQTLCLNSEEVPRNQLLLCLEKDSHWKYCAVCLKLHPRKDFTKLSLRCRSPVRGCAQSAGIVDLCPCISLTGAGRRKIIEQLTLQIPSVKRLYDYPFELMIEKNNQAHLVHRCYYGHSTRYNEMTLYIDETAQLVAKIQYNIQSDSAQSAKLESGPILACPHENLKDWIFYVNNRRDFDCNSCETWIKKLHKDTDLIIYEVTRMLGDPQGPEDYFWARQSRITYAHPSYSHIYGRCWQNSPVVREELRRDRIYRRVKRLAPLGPPRKIKFSERNDPIYKHIG